MSVLATLSAVPVVVVIVLPVPLTVSVPLSVALMPGAGGRVDVEAAAGEVERVAVAGGERRPRAGAAC